MQTARLGRTVSIISVVGLTVWIAVDLFGRNLFGGAAWPDSFIDYRLLYDYSRLVVRTHAYPADYPYPPPAVVLQYVSALPPFAVSAALWAGLCGVTALGCWLGLARLLRLDFDGGAYALLPLAHLSCSYFFQWDLRSGNCNLVFLALLLLGVHSLQRDRQRSAGFWFALAFSLKLFSVLVIPYLLWKGRRRAFAWTLAFACALWLLLPALVFGDGLVEVYAAWLGRFTHAVGRSADPNHPILTSLPRAADFLAGAGAPAIVNGVRGLWLVLGLLGWWASARRRSDDTYSLLGDVSLLTLAPIAVSPYLEPYHPVPFAIPALMLLRTLADREQLTRTRLLALIAFAAAVAVAKLPLCWEVRGLLLNAKLLLGVSGVVLVACLRRQPAALPCLALPAPEVLDSWPEERPGRLSGRALFRRFLAGMGAADRTARPGADCRFTFPRSPATITMGSHSARTGEPR
jgi:hypothetical protein